MWRTKHSRGLDRSGRTGFRRGNAAVRGSSTHSLQCNKGRQTHVRSWHKADIAIEAEMSANDPTRTTTITTAEKCELSKSDLIGGGSNKIAVVPRATQVNNFQSVTAFMSLVTSPVTSPASLVQDREGTVRRHAGDAHPSADLPADVSEPAFLTADQHTHRQEAEQNGDRAHKTASHFIQNSSRLLLVRSCSERRAGNLFAHFRHLMVRCPGPKFGRRAERSVSPQAERFLVIFGDDIGVANLSIYSDGLMGYETPNIDHIGKEGLCFLHYYGEQSCTAGRAAFLTGQHGIRTGLTKVGFPGAPMGMSQLDPSIGGIMKNLGYATGQFGKNHVGDRNESLPCVNGFDGFFGNLYHLNAEEEPELPDYPKDPEYIKKFGPYLAGCPAADHSGNLRKCRHARSADLTPAAHAHLWWNPG